MKDFKKCRNVAVVLGDEPLRKAKKQVGRQPTSVWFESVCSLAAKRFLAQVGVMPRRAYL